MKTKAPLRDGHSIPTLYNGVQFRSRLEAKWAAFFDLVSWRWVYEPVDFNGWIPDFVLTGERVVYVEVKPVFVFPEWLANEIEASGCEEEVLILGAGNPIRVGDHHCGPGWLGEIEPDWSRSWAEAVYGVWEETGKKIGFCHSEGSFHDRMRGGYNGCSVGDADADLDIEITALWRTAGNRVQWKAP